MKEHACTQEQFLNDVKDHQIKIIRDDDRPVYYGDRLYHKVHGHELVWEHPHGLDILFDQWSWHKPKTKCTFEINGVELPCHVRKRTPHTVNLEHDGVWVPLYFETLDEASEFYNKLRGIFINARDLE